MVVVHCAHVLVFSWICVCLLIFMSDILSWVSCVWLMFHYVHRWNALVVTMHVSQLFGPEWEVWSQYFVFLERAVAAVHHITMTVVRWSSDVTGRKPKLWAERHKNYKTNWNDFRVHQFYQQQVIWSIVVAALSSGYFFKFSMFCSFHPQTHKHKRLHLKQAECTTYVLPPHPGMRGFFLVFCLTSQNLQCVLALYAFPV